MKTFIVKAPNNDTAVIKIEADDIYQAAEAIAETFGVAVRVAYGDGEFETETGRYTLREIKTAQA